MDAMDVPFPTDVEEFDQDDRISFSKLDNKFIAVHDDGNEYEFDAKLKKWTLVEDEPLDDDDDGDAHAWREESSGPNSDDASSRKRRHGTGSVDLISETSRPARPSKKQKPPPQPRQNTAVYVTGLPLDATVDEVHELFSRKAGVVAEEIDSGAPRIKMYTDERGNFKGDALVVFFKPQSVEMAIMLLDDTDFRFTSSGTREGKMRVQAADSSYKKTNYDNQDGAEGGNGNGNGNGTGNGNGNGNDSSDRRPQRKDRDRDRQKIIKKTQKLDAKLADWDDDDPYPPTVTAASSKREKMVILRHMFTLEELEEDPAALLEIKEDIRDECSKLGAVTNVVLYDLEPEGIVSVKFKDVESAAACIKLMHGRSFDGRTVTASWSTGKDKFNKSRDETNAGAESD